MIVDGPVFRHNGACRHSALNDVSKYRANTLGSWSKSRVKCGKCGGKRVDVRPQLEGGEARQAARMNEPMGITDCYFVPEVGLTITCPRFDERAGLGKADEAVVDAAILRAKVCLRAIDDLKGEAQYLAGDELTLADLLLARHLVILRLTPEGEELIAAHPRLSAWVDGMLACSSMIATDHTRLQARGADRSS